MFNPHRSRFPAFTVPVRRCIHALLLCLLAATANQIALGQPFFGNALSFNGTNQAVVVTNFGNIVPTNEITVEFWAYTTRAAGQSAFAYNLGSFSERLNGHINYGGPPPDIGQTYWDFGNIFGAGRLQVAPPVNSISNWVHYAMVASHSGNYMRVYTNGVLQTNATGMTPITPGNFALYIGGPPGDSYNGLLGDFRIWSVARSAAQIQANYNTSLAGSESNLVLYYRFDSGSGTIATNYATATGATYNGTLTNSPTWLTSPSVNTLAATGTSNTVATLNGTVNPNGLATTAWFEWALYGFNFTHTTAMTNVGNGSGLAAASNALSGLTPGLTYQGRVVASNVVGVSRGPAVLFGSPIITLLNGGSLLTNECHSAFANPAAGAPMALAAGYEGSLVLKSDGTVVAWGTNGYGETNVPAGLSNVLAISAGYVHSLALNSDGTVVGWGDYAYGETTVPAGLSKVVAISAGDADSVALKSDGTVVAWGYNGYGETNVPVGLSNVVAISAGVLHNLALKSDGTVVAWGDNTYGETSIPTGLSNVVSLSGGYPFSLALKSDGTVFAWGSGGVTNVPTGLSNVVAISAGYSNAVALKSDGTVVAWGDGSYGVTNVPVGLSNVVAISAGVAHRLALKSDGTIVGWGTNTFGDLNIPANVYSFAGVSGNLNVNQPGSYPVTYFATNSLGGINVAQGTVVVQDTTPPAITILGNNPVITAVNAPYVDAGATAVDVCGGIFPVSSNSTVNVSVPGSYTVTYTSTDNYGNIANAVRTVVVGNPPTFSGLSAVVVGTNTAAGSYTVQFTATANPNGTDTTVNFQYGLTSAYGGINGPFSLPASVISSNFTVTISGFSPGKPYHWNIIGTTAAGSASAPDQTFTIGIPGDLNGDGIVSQSERDAVYWSYLTNGPSLYMSNVTGLGASNVTFALSNSFLDNYTVQYSTDLVNWSSLGPARLRFQFTDANAPASPRRFYQLSYP